MSYDNLEKIINESFEKEKIGPKSEEELRRLTKLLT